MLQFVTNCGIQIKVDFRFASPEWLSSDELGKSGSDPLYTMSLPESERSEEDIWSGAKLVADATSLVCLLLLTLQGCKN